VVSRFDCAFSARHEVIPQRQLLGLQDRFRPVGGVARPVSIRLLGEFGISRRTPLVAIVVDDLRGGPPAIDIAEFLFIATEFLFPPIARRSIENDRGRCAREFSSTALTRADRTRSGSEHPRHETLGGEIRIDAADLMMSDMVGSD